MSRLWLNLRFHWWLVEWGPSRPWPRVWRSRYWHAGLSPIALYEVRGPGWLVVFVILFAGLLLGWHALNFGLRSLGDL